MINKVKKLEINMPNDSTITNIKKNFASINPINFG